MFKRITLSGPEICLGWPIDFSAQTGSFQNQIITLENYSGLGDYVIDLFDSILAISHDEFDKGSGFVLPDTGIDENDLYVTAYDAASSEEINTIFNHFWAEFETVSRDESFKFFIKECLPKIHKECGKKIHCKWIYALCDGDGPFYKVRTQPLIKKVNANFSN